MYNEKLAKLAVKKSLLKEYSNSSNDRIVYMDDGTEFQIQLFNPYSYVIGVSFEFNESINYNHQLLVIRPGERIWLDRYLDKETKFLFSTYEVRNSKAVEEAIRNNGNLIIKFFKERENNTYFISNINLNNNKLYNDPLNIYSSDASNCFANAVQYSNFNTSLGINDSESSISTSNTSYLTGSATYTSASYDGTLQASTSRSLSKSIETGRVEEGSHSNQKFSYINKDFEYWPFKTEIIKILPTSQKQITSSDLHKKYCYECGKKLNQKYKFCPNCGAKQ